MRRGGKGAESGEVRPDAIKGTGRSRRKLQEGAPGGKDRMAVKRSGLRMQEVLNALVDAGWRTSCRPILGLL